MLKINLFCQLGISSSLFAKKLQEEINHQKLDWSVSANNIHDISEIYPTSDFVLVSPAVTLLPAYKKTIQQLEDAFPHVKIKTIDADIYFSLELEKMTKDIQKELKN